jgi:hypothetical protein
LFQIEFDSNWLTFQGVTAGSAATAAGKSVDANYVWRNRVYVIVYGGRTVLNDGEMLTVSFQVGTAPPETVFPLTGTQVSVSDPDVLRIPAVTTNGAINVAAGLRAR